MLTFFFLVMMFTLSTVKCVLAVGLVSFENVLGVEKSVFLVGRI